MEPSSTAVETAFAQKVIEFESDLKELRKLSTLIYSCRDWIPLDLFLNFNYSWLEPTSGSFQLLKYAFL